MFRTQLPNQQGERYIYLHPPIPHIPSKFQFLIYPRILNLPLSLTPRRKYSIYIHSLPLPLSELGRAEHRDGDGLAEPVLQLSLRRHRLAGPRLSRQVLDGVDDQHRRKPRQPPLHPHQRPLRSAHLLRPIGRRPRCLLVVPDQLRRRSNSEDF